MRAPVIFAAAAPLLVAPVLVTAPAQADSIVKQAKVQREIKRGFMEQAKVKVDVKCPAKVRWKKGKTFFCTAKDAKGEKYKVQVKLGSESKGRLTWKVIP